MTIPHALTLAESSDDTKQAPATPALSMWKNEAQADTMPSKGVS